MVSLIALLSSGQGTWGQVGNLIKLNNWDKVYLICNEFAYENFKINYFHFSTPPKILKLKFNENNPNQTFQNLAKFFTKDIKDFEVALNFTSGSGIEHMAVLSATLKAGLGIRFVYAQENKLKEFEILDGTFEPETIE